ncbi:MAG: hypothetical protein ACOYL6_13875 [Bacteriovoracaceae bacterium]
MKKFSAPLMLSLLAISCSNLSSRGPASGLTPPSFQDGFLKAGEEILDDVKKKEFDSDVCVTYLKDVEQELDATDMKKLPKEELKRDGKKIADISWDIRDALHQRLSEFNKDCVIQIQSNFRQLRFVEDYLLEKVTGVTNLGPEEISLMDADGKINSDLKKKEIAQLTKENKIGFQAQAIPMKEAKPYYVFRQKNGSIEPLELKGGDLLITRGLSFLSAMIARLGQRGTQFSHVVMVNQNEKTKELQTIESYVGAGVGFYNMDFALKNENARILWLRPKDKEIGAKANRIMGKYVKDRIDNGNPIHYDYALDFNDHSTMSCAEVSQVAYEKATDGEMSLPFYKNEVTGAQPLLDHMGIKGGETYEPGDMEIDPRFELMGEFQDLRLTRDSRQKDAIMTMMFKWMDEENYVLKDSFNSKLAGGIIFNARHSIFWPLVKAAFGLDDFSKEIPKAMLRTVTLLKDIGGVMLKEVKEKDLAFEKEHGMPMNYMELYKVLEDFRKRDLSLYQNKKTKKEALFHPWFHPKK